MSRVVWKERKRHLRWETGGKVAAEQSQSSEFLSHRRKFVRHLHPHPRRPHTSRLIVQNDAANKGMQLLSLWTMSFQLLSAHRRRGRLRSSELPTIFLLRNIKGCLVLKGFRILPGSRQFHNEQNSRRQPLRIAQQETKPARRIAVRGGPSCGIHWKRRGA